MIKRLSLTALILMSVGPSIHARTINRLQCISIYRKNYVQLRAAVDDFSSQVLSKWDFATEVSAISKEADTYRLTCLRIENSYRGHKGQCLRNYRDLYEQLRGRINLKAIIDYEHPGQPENRDFNSFLNSIIDYSNTIIDRSELYYFDAICYINV